MADDTRFAVLNFGWFAPDASEAFDLTGAIEGRDRKIKLLRKRFKRKVVFDEILRYSPERFGSGDDHPNRVTIRYARDAVRIPARRTIPIYAAGEELEGSPRGLGAILYSVVCEAQHVLPEEMAVGGYMGLDEMLDDLHRHYPGVSETSPVTISRYSGYVPIFWTPDQEK